MHNRDHSFNRCLTSLLVATTVIVFSNASAQIGNLNRPYEPVIVKGDKFPAFSNNVAPLNQLFLYRYKSAGNIWEQIPWQIDEVEPDSLDPTKTTYFRGGDGMLDDLDELSFMAKDAADQATDNNWIKDASSRGFARYEIEANDPRVVGSKAYVYLYRSTTVSVSPMLSDYVTYVPPPAQAGNDTVRGLTYEEGHHQQNGIHNYLRVPFRAGGGVDFVDRLKLRFQISFFGILISITEDNFNLIEIKVHDGRVRLIRELKERVTLGGNNIDFPVLILYYGYSSVLGTVINLNLGVPVTLLRQSFDFEPNVNGAKWHNQNITTPITITGNFGNLTPAQAAVVNSPQLNWYMLSSMHGSFINIFSLPAGLGTSQRFYFHDAPSGTNDGTPDTGANGSFGDSGLLVTGNNITGVFTLALTNYILGKDQPRSVGETLRDQTVQPLMANAQEQNFTGVPVALFATLNGIQEVPPVVTAGHGLGLFLLSDDGSQLNFDIAVGDLSGPITAAHFHHAAAGVAGPSVRDITGNFINNRAIGAWTDQDAEPLTPALVAELLADKIYVNVHTAANPDGEIRGQLGKSGGHLGDVNGDENCNSTDALLILSFDAGLPIPPAFADRINAGFGDVNADSLTNSTDALIVLSFDGGLQTPFPVCQTKQQSKSSL